MKPKTEITIIGPNVQNLWDRFIRNEIGIFLLDEDFRKRVVGIIFPKVSPVIVAQGYGMMKLVKVIKAKVSQYSPTKSRDLEKVGPKSLQLKKSMFLSFLLTQSAENFSKIVGEIGANLLTLS